MEEIEIKKVTIFEIFKILTETDKTWEQLSDGEKKAFNPFMITELLSMIPEFIEISNEFQRYAISSSIQPRDVYRFYKDIIPKGRYSFKWIKAINNDIFGKQLVDIFTREYECSRQEAKEYLELFMSIDRLDLIVKVVSKYGFTESQVESIILNKDIKPIKAKKETKKKK